MTLSRLHSSSWRSRTPRHSASLACSYWGSRGPPETLTCYMQPSRSAHVHSRSGTRLPASLGSSVPSFGWRPHQLPARILQSRERSRSPVRGGRPPREPLNRALVVSDRSASVCGKAVVIILLRSPFSPSDAVSRPWGQNARGSGSWSPRERSQQPAAPVTHGRAQLHHHPGSWGAPAFRNPPRAQNFHLKPGN